MRKEEHDFLAWTSFPSSIKFTNDTEGQFQYLDARLPVVPGRKVTVEVNGKGENQIIHPMTHLGTSHFSVDGVRPDGSRFRIASESFPLGSFDWRKFSLSFTVPNDVWLIYVDLWSGTGLPEKPNIAWFDDLKIYMDDVLIYSNDFSNWSPVIGVGVGAPIGGVAGYLLKEPLGPMVSEVVGAVVGGAVGGGIGLLTALGIIPVPTIPSLGAAPEGPGAPARLGKYQITG